MQKSPSREASRLRLSTARLGSAQPDGRRFDDQTGVPGACTGLFSDQTGVFRGMGHASGRRKGSHFGWDAFLVAGGAPIRNGTPSSSLEGLPFVLGGPNTLKKILFGVPGWHKS